MATRSGIEATAALEAALHTVTSVAHVALPDDGATALDVEFVDGQRIEFDVKAMAHPTREEASAIARRKRRRRSRRGLVLVADQLSFDAQQDLVRAGVSFFDRRGRIVLVTPQRTIEADVEAADRPRRAFAAPAVRGASGISVALVTLLVPDQPLKVRATARAAGLSHTAVALARDQLRAAHLLDQHLRPVLPDLFEALVRVWTWSSEVETALPPAGDERLRAAGAALEGPFFDTVAALDRALPKDAGNTRDAVAGWAMTGARAAAAYGADVVVGRDAPTNWIVPQDRFLTATRLHAQLTGGGEPARVLAAPSLLAVRLRRPGPGGALAHPLVVAVDLARDPGRGREILETFEPEGATVVWR